MPAIIVGFRVGISIGSVPVDPPHVDSRADLEQEGFTGRILAHGAGHRLWCELPSACELPAIKRKSDDEYYLEIPDGKELFFGRC